MRLTRHNGRAGKNGTYNPKHNDRRFDIQNSEHIDVGRAKHNIYWDCYRGFTSPIIHERNTDNDFTFEQVELSYYFEHYQDHITAQNERNEKSRHTERNRTVEDLLKNKKTCPEETIYQIGNIDESVPAEVLTEICTEYFAELEEKFGSHFHILDWALHLDEATPHIQERHVFDCENNYGELCPQQEKALEEMGIPLPEPDKKKGKHNNRKMTFDAECRKMLFAVCERHNLHLEVDPAYGGRDYLEKQDFIIAKQKGTIAEQGEVISQQRAELVGVSTKVSAQKKILSETSSAVDVKKSTLEKAEKALAERKETIKQQDSLIAEKRAAIIETHEELKAVTMRLSDMEAVADEVAETAYKKACELVADTVREETKNADIGIIEKQKKWLSAPERKDDLKLRNYAIKYLDKVIDKIKGAVKEIAGRVAVKLQEPERKTENLEQIKASARKSLKAKLGDKLKEVEDYKAEQQGMRSQTQQKKRGTDTIE